MNIFDSHLIASVVRSQWENARQTKRSSSYVALKTGGGETWFAFECVNIVHAWGLHSRPLAVVLRLRLRATCYTPLFAIALAARSSRVDVGRVLAYKSIILLYGHATKRATCCSRRMKRATCCTRRIGSAYFLLQGLRFHAQLGGVPLLLFDRTFSGRRQTEGRAWRIALLGHHKPARRHHCRHRASLGRGRDTDTRIFCLVHARTSFSTSKGRRGRQRVRQGV
jgi:hypothetical protein